MNSTGLQTCRWHSCSDVHALNDAAYETILACASNALQVRDRFHFVLAGGNTPREIYRRLHTAPTDWSAWNIWFGDERCLTPTHSARNSQMAAEVWLDFVPVPPAQIHTIPAELGAILSARIYAEQLSALGDFDLVLLGLGEDGHTASLFPGHEWGSASGSPDAIAVFAAPKPPAQRVTLSAARLSRARKVIFLISGESKHKAVTEWRAGKAIPARAIIPVAGVDVLVESALLIPQVI